MKEKPKEYLLAEVYTSEKLEVYFKVFSVDNELVDDGLNNILIMSGKINMNSLQSALEGGIVLNDIDYRRSINEMFLKVFTTTQIDENTAWNVILTRSKTKASRKWLKDFNK